MAPSCFPHPVPAGLCWAWAPRDSGLLHTAPPWAAVASDPHPALDTRPLTLPPGAAVLAWPAPLPRPQAAWPCPTTCLSSQAGRVRASRQPAGWEGEVEPVLGAFLSTACPPVLTAGPHAEGKPLHEFPRAARATCHPGAGPGDARLYNRHIQSWRKARQGLEGPSFLLLRILIMKI